MRAPASVTRAGQSLAPGDLVALYTIDLTPLGVSGTFSFTPSVSRSRRPLQFRTTTYVPLDVQCDGFAYSGVGPLPQPTLTLSNVNRLLSSAAILYRDLIGARLVRTRTYAQFLADGETPDDSASYADDVYFFEQKKTHNKKQISWTLAASMDQEGRKLPARLIFREVCPFRYRAWSPASGVFNYDHVVCPYTGDQSYDRYGTPVSPDKDEPGRHLNDCCRVRFGRNAPLPFGGFPGVARTRQ